MHGEGADEEEIIVTRSVPAEGGPGPGSTDACRRPARWPRSCGPLLEIHGQHEHQSLVTPTAQRNVLDAFAGTDLGEVLRLRSRLRELVAALDELGGDAAARAREADVLRYQVEEIASAQLAGPDEEDELRA